MSSTGQPLLTVAIPTYNRDNYLKSQLQRLCAMTRNRSNVEVLVCDNASTDNTQEVVEEFRKANANLCYWRSEKNAGLYGNVLEAYERSRGRYVWYLTDDDPVQEGAVEALVRLLGQECHMVLTLGVIGEDGDARGDHADYFNWKTDGVVEAFFGTVGLMTLVLRKVEVDMTAFRDRPATVFPQVTLSLELLKQEFHLAKRPIPVVKRSAGHIVHNFFELYCLAPCTAVRSATWPEIEGVLIDHIARYSFREFVRLQFLERVGIYESRQGLPWSTWRSGWVEFGKSPSNCLRLLAILALSIIPRPLARWCAWLLLLFRTGSPRSSSKKLKALMAWRAEVRFADV